MDDLITAEPVFSLDGNLKKNILEHAESIDTYESKYISIENNLTKLFKIITFNTNFVGDDLSTSSFRYKH